jgi:hypothetical protein
MSSYPVRNHFSVPFYFRHRSSVAKSAGARQHFMREGATLPFSEVNVLGNLKRGDEPRSQIQNQTASSIPP